MANKQYQVVVGPSPTDGKVIKSSVSVGPQGPTGPEGPIRKYIEVRILSDVEQRAVGSNLAGDIRLPFAGTITDVGAYVDTAGTTGTTVVDILLNGSTIMATNKINIDSGLKNSENSTIQPIITTSTYVRLDVLTIDIPQVTGSPGNGLVVWLDILQ